MNCDHCTKLESRLWSRNDPRDPALFSEPREILHSPLLTYEIRSAIFGDFKYLIERIKCHDFHDYLKPVLKEGPILRKCMVGARFLEFYGDKIVVALFYVLFPLKCQLLLIDVDIVPFDKRYDRIFVEQHISVIRYRITQEFNGCR